MLVGLFTKHTTLITKYCVWMFDTDQISDTWHFTTQLKGFSGKINNRYKAAKWNTFEIMDHVDRCLNLIFHHSGGDKTSRSTFKCHCLFVCYVNILTGNVSDSPINQLSVRSLSIPCFAALCKTAIYSICVICRLMERHSLRNSKQDGAWNRSDFLAHYLPI